MNFRQHGDLEISFSGSLIAILGRNGAGKSNFAGALQFNLTGEQPGANKKDLVKWGESDGYVDLEFEHSGHECRLKRNIASPACSLVVDGKRTNGAKAVEAVLKESFGIDRDLFKQVVFVRQAEIDSILFDEPRKRELAFQRLAGLGDTEKMYNVIGGVLTKYDHPEDYDTLLDDAKRSFDETKSRLTGFMSQISEMKKRLGEMPSKDDMLGLLRQIQSDIATNTHVLNDARTLDSERATLESLKKKLAELVSSAEAAGCDTVENLARLHERCSRAVEQVETYLGLVERKKSQQQLLDRVMSEEIMSEEQISGLESRYREIGDEIAAQTSKLNTLNDYIRIVHDSGNCPVCGSSLGFNLSEKLKTEADGIKAAIERLSLSRPVNNFILLRDTLSRHDRAISEARSAISSIDEQIDTIVARYPTIAGSDIEKGRNMLADASERLSRAKAFESKKSEVENKIAVSKSIIKRLETDSVGDLDDETSIRLRIDDLTSQAATVSDGIAKYDSISNSISSLDGSIKATEEQVGAADRYIKDLEVRKNGSIELRRRIKVLERVRQALHYTAIPRMLSQRIIDQLASGVNEYLELFSAPFTVEPSNDGVGFLCRFNDGRQMPKDLPDATFLSGGQKVQLAVAFRFATYGMFASKLGLLVLDEPTAYLDESAINRFGDVLKKIMTVAKSMNVQVLCATHHAQVSAQADQTINL